MTAAGSTDRVVVTGIGSTIAEAKGAPALWDRLVDGPSGPPAAGDPPIAPDLLDPKEASRSSMVMRIALQAASEAIATAGGLEAVPPERRGVVVASLYGSPRDVVAAEAATSPRPFLTITAGENAPAATIAARHACRGPVRGLVTACAGGTDAIIEAVDLIRSGRVDCVIAGGAQERLSPGLAEAYRELRVLSKSGTVRPFDRRRDGFVLAPGAAALVLESEAGARRRGARPLATVLGGASTNDAEHPIRPSGTGALLCVLAALDDAGTEPSAIAAINAHGTATWVNDRLEAEVIREVFGATPPPVTSNKGVIGHTFAAAGALEAVATVLSFAEGVIPAAVIGFEADPTLALDVVVEEPRAWRPGPVVSTSFGLGGQNAAVVLAPA